jgi:hypothetical protein
MTHLIELDGVAIAESLAQSLEMSFISVGPAEPPFPAPAEISLVRIAFTGPLCGALEMLTARGLGALLLSNVTGEGPDSISADQADDALKEIMNVVCGALLRGAPGAPQFEISLPTVALVENDQAWSDFVSFDGTTVIDAEGNLIGVRVAPCF